MSSSQIPVDGRAQTLPRKWVDSSVRVNPISSTAGVPLAADTPGKKK